MDKQTTQTEAEVIHDMAIRGIAPVSIAQGSKPFITMPFSCKIEDVEEYLPIPTRKCGRVTLFDVKGFIDFFNVHKSDNSHIYFNPDKCAVTAIFNDDAAIPGWKDHKATYQCPLSTEWQAWGGASGRQKSQDEFAEFIENNLPDIYSDRKEKPTAAQLLEVATNFKINKKVNFSSAKRMDNGQVSFEYVEDIQGTAGAKGQIKVPEKFWIAIPIFKNGSTYELECRLKYRLKEGQLFMWFDLYRAEKVRDTAFADVIDRIAEGCKAPMFSGDI